MWSRRDAAVVVVLLSWALAGCAGRLVGAGGVPQQFEGHLTAEGGRSLFRPCDAAGTDSLWWASFHGYASEQRERLAASGLLNLPRPLFVRVYADLSDPRPPAPHQLGTTRDLYVREVMETRLSGECGQPRAQSLTSR